MDIKKKKFLVLTCKIQVQHVKVVECTPETFTYLFYYLFIVMSL